MTASAFHPETLQTAIEDHEIISQFIENVGKLFTGEQGADVKEAIEAITLLLNKKILDHFAYEEDHVFAVLLADRPAETVARLIAELIAEHETLRKKARQLKDDITRPAAATGTGGLLAACRNFISDLEDHAAKEDDLFLALLEKPAGA